MSNLKDNFARKRHLVWIGHFRNSFAMDRIWVLLLQSVIWALLPPTHGAPLPRDPRTALDEYVSALDPHYSYTVLDDLTRRDEVFTTYVLNMTSLKWLNGNIRTADPCRIGSTGYGSFVFSTL